MQHKRIVEITKEDVQRQIQSYLPEHIQFAKVDLVRATRDIAQDCNRDAKLAEQKAILILNFLLDEKWDLLIQNQRQLADIHELLLDEEDFVSIETDTSYDSNIDLESLTQIAKQLSSDALKAKSNYLLACKNIALVEKYATIIVNDVNIESFNQELDNLEIESISKANEALADIDKSLLKITDELSHAKIALEKKLS